MKKLLLFFVLISFAGFSQPLSGNYVIGASQAAPFNTLTNAVNRINAVGVNGPVVFLLNDVNYTTATGETFPISISKFSGTNETNTLTIKPNASKTVIIRADNINSYTSTQAVIKLNGAQNVIINGSNNGTTSKNLSIINTNALEYSKKSVIWFANDNNNGASNNTITNAYIRQQVFKGDLSIGVYSGGANLDLQPAQTPNANNTIDNVTFSKAGQGIYITGNSGLQVENWTITNSAFGASDDADKAYLGIYLKNVKKYIISNNTIDGILKTTTDYNPIHAGIYADTNCSEGKIFNNTIANIKETTGSASSTGILINGDQTIVYNNMIHNVSAKGNGGNLNNGFGILINSGQTIAVYHNTIRMATNQSGGFSAALYVNGGTALSILNNIFVNAQTAGATRYAIYAAVPASAFTKINYNDYYSSQHLGFLGSNKTALANWKTATSQDANSVSLLPVFASSTDLHIATSGNLALDNLGTPIATVTSDIDGVLRSTVKPDLGAAEFDAAKCGTSTTWNGISWSNGAPTSAVKAIFNGNYSTALGNISACEIVVSLATTITINAGQYIEVQNDATIYGDIVVENGGSFLQVREDSGNTLAASGKFTMKRTTSPIRSFDFVYWSSPIENQTLYNLSPETRFDKYYKYSPAIGNWVIINNGTEVMENGKGYIARGPSNFSQTVAAPFSTAFVGKPHNGPVNVSVEKSVDNMNLIGNPYPSAIDAKLFLNDATNTSLIAGTVYLWTHATAITQIGGTNTYGYASDDYAAYNKIGGIKTNAAGTVFQGKIAAGQAFFVEAVTSGTAVFKNSMRLKGDNQQFYKESLDPSVQNTDNRFWLNLTNEQGAFKQTLIGYANGASDGYDQQYDGMMLNGNNYVNFYTIVGDKNLVIQGRGLPFTDNQQIALGFSATIAGTFTIALDSFDGLFSSQSIFLIDKLSHTVQNLKDGAYTFSTAAGTFNSRFEIRFANETLASQNPIAVANETIVCSKNNNIQIKSNTNFDTVTIYDLNGKQLFSKRNIAEKDFNTGTLTVASQIVLVTVESTTGTLTKKVLL